MQINRRRRDGACKSVFTDLFRDRLCYGASTCSCGRFYWCWCCSSCRWFSCCWLRSDFDRRDYLRIFDRFSNQICQIFLVLMLIGKTFFFFVSQLLILLPLRRFIFWV